MPEKEREKSKSPSEEQLTHVVQVMGETFRISLPKGSTLKDLLEKFKKDNPSKSLETVANVIVNNVPIEVKKGELTYNPVLSQASAVTLVANITGGLISS